MFANYPTFAQVSADFYSTRFINDFRVPGFDPSVYVVFKDFFKALTKRLLLSDF